MLASIDNSTVASLCPIFQEIFCVCLVLCEYDSVNGNMKHHGKMKGWEKFWWIVAVITIVGGSIGYGFYFNVWASFSDDPSNTSDKFMPLSCIFAGFAAWAVLLTLRCQMIATKAERDINNRQMFETVLTPKIQVFLSQKKFCPVEAKRAYYEILAFLKKFHDCYCKNPNLQKCCDYHASVEEKFKKRFFGVYTNDAKKNGDGMGAIIEEITSREVLLAQYEKAFQNWDSEYGQKLLKEVLGYVQGLLANICNPFAPQMISYLYLFQFIKKSCLDEDKDDYRRYIAEIINYRERFIFWFYMQIGLEDDFDYKLYEDAKPYVFAKSKDYFCKRLLYGFKDFDFDLPLWKRFLGTLRDFAWKDK